MNFSEQHQIDIARVRSAAPLLNLSVGRAEFLLRQCGNVDGAVHTARAEERRMMDRMLHEEFEAARNEARRMAATRREEEMRLEAARIELIRMEQRRREEEIWLENARRENAIREQQRRYNAVNAVFKNMENAGNSCYISAIIAACFAVWDAWDPLLEYGRSPNEHAMDLRRAVLDLVIWIRSENAADASTVERVRQELMQFGFPTGTDQEDASDFFGTLMDKLGAPLLQFRESVRHRAMPEDEDNRTTRERLIWLECPGESNTTIRELITKYFSETQSNVRRRRNSMGRLGVANVPAMISRELIPSYAPVRPQDDERRANPGSYNKIAVPFAIRRYSKDRRKNRTAVQIPVVMDFKHTSGYAPGNEYSLVLKSIVCHLGDYVESGHYIAYTFDKASGWRKWNDMKPGFVEQCSARPRDHLPIHKEWRNDIKKNSYIVFFELANWDECRLWRFGQRINTDGSIGSDIRLEEDHTLFEGSDSECSQSAGQEDLAGSGYLTPTHTAGPGSPPTTCPSIENVPLASEILEQAQIPFSPTIHGLPQTAFVPNELLQASPLTDASHMSFPNSLRVTPLMGPSAQPPPPLELYVGDGQSRKCPNCPHHHS